MELPLSTDELRARLDEIVEVRPPTAKAHFFSKPLTGDLQARELRLTRTRHWFPPVVVSGSLTDRERGCTATLVISVDPGVLASSVLIAMVALLVYAAGGRVLAVVLPALLVGLVAYGVRRTARYGIDDTRRLLATALDPRRELEDATELERWKVTPPRPPDLDALMKRLEDWERRNVK